MTNKTNTSYDTINSAQLWQIMIIATMKNARHLEIIRFNTGLGGWEFTKAMSRFTKQSRNNSQKRMQARGRAMRECPFCSKVEFGHARVAQTGCADKRPSRHIPEGCVDDVADTPLPQCRCLDVTTLLRWRRRHLTPPVQVSRRDDLAADTHVHNRTTAKQLSKVIGRSSKHF